MMPTSSARASRVPGCLVALALLPAACAYSSYQSAKMLPMGGTQLTAAVSSYSAYVDGNNNGSTAFEVMGSRGLTDRLELGGKFSFVNEEEDGYTLLVVPKYSLSPDTLALTMPAGVMFTSQDDTDHIYELFPGVIYTRQISPDFELDLAGQVLVAVNSDFDDSEIYLGTNVGVALSPHGAAWAFHPEVGLLVPTGDAADTVDYFIQFGLGFSYKFGVAPPAAAAPVAGL